ncbi:hypothetical protein VTL71DRAFT_5020 [Oculimacula yallundae]|uniref:Uncharacterized protein n=1 Tax=Oculimacula yallundae TaxID=86028 RepID=A0ABR4C125_9HELO
MGLTRGNLEKGANYLLEASVPIVMRLTDGSFEDGATSEKMAPLRWHIDYAGTSITLAHRLRWRLTNAGVKADARMAPSRRRIDYAGDCQTLALRLEQEWLPYAVSSTPLSSSSLG